MQVEYTKKYGYRWLQVQGVGTVIQMRIMDQAASRSRAARWSLNALREAEVFG